MRVLGRAATLGDRLDKDETHSTVVGSPAGAVKREDLGTGSSYVSTGADGEGGSVAAQRCEAAESRG